MRKRRCKKSVESEKKAGKVQQVIEGGGVQVGTCERPGKCQPGPIRKKNRSKMPGSQYMLKLERFRTLEKI